MSRSTATRLVLAGTIAVVVFLGWRELWFSCDDAFIAYRYASNSVLEHGMVWNPPPFQPVEGYTQFLWIVLLSLVWSLTGIEPPDCATEISLLFGYATLLVGWRMAVRLHLAPRVERARTAIVVLVIVGLATSRVFLTWLSFGLEASMFTFLLAWWIWFATTARTARGGRWVFGLASTATAAALTRMDGWLCVLATLLLLLQYLLVDERARRTRLVVLLCATPLLAIPAHLLWRVSFYGEWLPNTYHAKVTGWWPESGLRYLASFVVENGVWVWLLLAAGWAVREVITGHLRPRWLVREHAGAILAVGVVVAHALFYTVKVGGDMFEYRVYSHLPLLLLVSGAWMAARLVPRPVPAIAALALLVFASWPIAWLHHLDGNKLVDRMPRLVRPLLTEFAEWQRWLNTRMVCQRRDAHNGFLRHQIEVHPKRIDGAKVSSEGRPVYVATAAGVAGWSMPHVALIDHFGLNDWVVARHPVTTLSEKQAEQAESRRTLFGLDKNNDGKLGLDEIPELLVRWLPQVARYPDHWDNAARLFLQARDKNGDGGLDAEEVLPAAGFRQRLMGHERAPPPGYVEGFRPNVFIENRKIRVEQRQPPLTDSDIIEWEKQWRRRK